MTRRGHIVDLDCRIKSGNDNKIKEPRDDEKKKESGNNRVKW